MVWQKTHSIILSLLILSMNIKIMLVRGYQGFVPYQSAKNELINKHTKDIAALEESKTPNMLSSPTLQLNLISHLPRSKRIFNNEEDSEKKDDERIVNKLQLMELKDKRNFQSRRKNILDIIQTMEKRSTHKLRSENSDSEWKDRDITTESKVEPLINVPCTPSHKSPFPLIPFMEIDGDVDTSEKVNDRVMNKIQLMEWRDRSIIDRNRQKILKFLNRQPNKNVPLDLLEKQLEKLQIIEAIKHKKLPQQRTPDEEEKLKRIQNDIRIVRDLFLNLYH